MTEVAQASLGGAWPVASLQSGRNVNVSLIASLLKNPALMFI